jgi:NADP-dependent 3-hydroxy acid dehydrogenase YdfG
LTGDNVDVTDDSALRRMVETIVATHRRLDVLVNTVGGYKAGMKFWEQDSKILDQMLDLNVRSGYVYRF